MKISLNWLKDYIELSTSAEETAEILTDCGLEVEGIENFESIPGGLQDLVIGEVIECVPHPNADRLKLTKVDVGEDQLLSIVCGAPNVAKGQKVVVAKVGSTLYPSEGDAFAIKKSKIRGALSEGMICAEDEIGLGSSHDGIMLLDKNAKVGSPAAVYFNLSSDKVLEIGLTPNRSDATSHYGVARDLAAVINLNSKIELKKPSVEDFEVDETTSKISVEIRDSIACPRYSGLSISGLELMNSPDWLQKKLKAIGIKPINNIVDVTNFVLHEIGQPLHAFDADKIKGDKIIVQSLPNETDFVTLDEKGRKLHSEDLMICNSEEGMCLAGIFGGTSSGVSRSTKNIFLESAYFNPVSIRKSAKRHALNTDASFRYERGADPDITVYALKRAAMLIKEVAGGKISSEIIDIYPKKIEAQEVDFNFDNCNRLIGQEIDKQIIKKIFKNLEIQLLEENEQGLKIAVPPFKVDVKREVDLIEEVLRIYGYNHIELPSFMKTSLSFSEKLNPQTVEDQIANFLSSNGFYEIFNNSLSNPAYYAEKDDLVEILNPLSSELQVMRQTLLYGGLEAIQYNRNRKKENLQFYEFGKSYMQLEDSYQERRQLAIFLCGESEIENWEKKAQKQDFYRLKMYVHSILEKLGVPTNVKSEKISDSIFAYSLQYSLGKNDLVQFGMLDNKLLAAKGIKTETYFAEFNWDAILKIVPSKEIKYKAVAKFPSVRRDLALLIDENIHFSSIEQIARDTEKKLLKKVDLFDVYEGSKLPQGKKSYAVSFTFQDENNTLTDQLVDNVMDQLISKLKEGLKVELR